MHPDVDVPVARLPPEILALIFSTLSSTDPPRSKRSRAAHRKRKYKLGWLTATHVCQRWRNIALCDPALWASNIVLPSVLGDRWAAAFVARAQNVPLTIWCNDFSSDRPAEALSDTSFIGANIATIMHLRTYLYQLRTLCTPAPLLRTLIIKTYDQERLLPDALPVFCGAGGLPELRHLSVITWEPQNWTPLLLAQLVSVDMAFLVQLTGAELASILAPLGRMPALERLSLQVLGPADTSEVPVALLPALRHLTLGETVNEALPILAHLALPAGVRVSCDVNWSEGAADALPTLFPAMMTCAHAAAISRVDVTVQLAAAPDCERDVEVCAWRSGQTDGAPALTVRFSGWTNLPAVLKPLASTHLEVLAVGGDVPTAAWLGALESAPGLHHVTVKGGALPAFCTAFGCAPGFVPALSTLVVNVHAAALAANVLWKTLPRCLAARARAGNFLKALEVVGYGEDEACARTLQEAVPGLAIQWSCVSEPEEGDEKGGNKDNDNKADFDFSSSQEEEEADSSVDVSASDVST
ncbi:hypothetical protein FA95DRAFT_1682596 [Auriscalpium vulgare]|uniref:Uncharacterized protein n=1 Tax=Auriscalpium vulgare TaxID=40419 RepID=A0ACB8RER0_9AGAM|nr:hypothetical protein FA95DRAFT_1682596 [Auriscalpium vulgare]